jgi:nicotinate-nucleotide pyrophosphorylase (carboxylating)
MLGAAPEVTLLIDLALAEDVRSGDVTTRAIFPEPVAARGRIVARTETVVCGLDVAREVFRRLDPGLVLTPCFGEAAVAPAGSTMARVRGDLRALLTGERTALNFLMRLCGIASGTRRAVLALPRATRAKLYDTRKTTPGWRLLEKAAVRAGGGHNHRMGLYDAVLIKDNHVAALGSVGAAVRRARAESPGMPITVEIDGLAQLDEALAAKPDVILLDNFSLEAMREAVVRTAARVPLEASGGVTLDRLFEIAETGVDRISMGALTHTVRPADISLEIDPGPVLEPEVLDSVDSTMLEARRRADAGTPEGCTVVARTQTGGRGRRGRTWYSEAGAGLYLTTFVQPPPSEHLHALALVAGVAVREAAEALGARDVKLKWPNDVVVGDRKLAGVLLESDVAPELARVFIGIGLNLAARSSLALPEELDGIYCGLADAAGRSVTHDEALRAVLDRLEVRYGEWLVRGAEPAITAWREHDALLGSVVRAESAGGTLEGVAEGIDDGGRLRVRDEGRVVLVSAGEVVRVRPSA